jgi:hypothetical protein
MSAKRQSTTSAVPENADYKGVHRISVTCVTDGEERSDACDSPGISGFGNSDWLSIRNQTRSESSRTKLVCYFWRHRVEERYVPGLIRMLDPLHEHGPVPPGQPCSFLTLLSRALNNPS